MAVLYALTSFSLVSEGFRNRDLRGQVAGLLGLTQDRYTPGKMSYEAFACAA